MSMRRRFASPDWSAKKQQEEVYTLYQGDEDTSDKEASTPYNGGALSEIPLFLIILSFRLVNALTIRTFFQPDEYFQVLEPAWELAFGSESGAWITWEWNQRLRSSLHPILFASAYKLAGWVAAVLPKTVQSDIYLIAPKILQTIFAASNDYYTWKLGNAISGIDMTSHRDSKSLLTLVLSLTSPWNWFCSTRTFSNSLETALTAYALSEWPWKVLSKRSIDLAKPVYYSPWIPSFLAAALATILRPTNALVWICVTCLTLPTQSISRIRQMIITAVGCGATILAVSVLSDRWFYGEWVLPAFRFVYFNVVQSLAQFYGDNRVDYYWTEGLPLLLTTALPFALWGILFGIKKRYSDGARSPIWVLACTVLFVPVVLSFIGHKEVRFLYPLLPALLVIASTPVIEFLYGGMVTSQPRGATSSSASPNRLLICSLLLSANFIIGRYLGNTHQSGVIQVVHHLREEYESQFSPLTPISATQHSFSVGFLMPCHSTPWRSHLIHNSIDAWALSCEPPVNIPVGSVERTLYRDEADQFYDHPEEWLTSQFGSNSTGSPNFESKRAWPKRLVMFEELFQRVNFNQIRSAIAAKTGGAEDRHVQQYRECWRVFNTHWHDDWRRSGDVIVLCLDEVAFNASKAKLALKAA